MSYINRCPYICAYIMVGTLAFLVGCIGVCLLHSEFKPTYYHCKAGADGIVRLPGDCVRVG